MRQLASRRRWLGRRGGRTQPGVQGRRRGRHLASGHAPGLLEPRHGDALTGQVGREGLETTLILYSNTRQATGGTAGEQTATPILAALLGIAVAVLLGYLLYRGAISIDLTRFFTWTGVLLVFVAAGVLAYGFHDLQEAALLPGLHSYAFDVSDVIGPGTWVGTLLKGTLNFSPQTTWLEAAVWLLYVVPVLALFVRRVRRPRLPAGAPAAA